MRFPGELVIAAVLVAATSTGCDEIKSLFEPGWDPVDANGEKGALHFVTNPYDMRVGLPEHVRVERHEKRTVTKPGGAKEEQERERSVQVVLAQCRPASVCDAKPHSEDSREVVVTPRMIGTAELEVTVALDGKENMSDRIKIAVAP